MILTLRRAVSFLWYSSENSLNGGSITVSGNGDKPEVLEYFPKANFYGYDEFFITAFDGNRESELKFEVFVRPIPDPPAFKSIEEVNFPWMQVKALRFF